MARSSFPSLSTGIALADPDLDPLNNSSFPIFMPVTILRRSFPTNRQRVRHAVPAGAGSSSSRPFAMTRGALKLSVVRPRHCDQNRENRANGASIAFAEVHTKLIEEDGAQFATPSRYIWLTCCELEEIVMESPFAERARCAGPCTSLQVTSRSMKAPGEMTVKR